MYTAVASFHSRRQRPSDPQPVLVFLLDPPEHPGDLGADLVVLLREQPHTDGGHELIRVPSHGAAFEGVLFRLIFRDVRVLGSHLQKEVTVQSDAALGPRDVPRAYYALAARVLAEVFPLLLVLAPERGIGVDSAVV